MANKKQERIAGYSTITGRFHKNPHYELLKKIVTKSKDIPTEYKEKILLHLRKEDITEFFIGDGKKYKYLFANAMFYRAYEIFTTSLMAYHLRNRNSIYLLIRAQFENISKIAYYLKHPDKIREYFDPKKDYGPRILDWSRCLVEIYKEDDVLKNLNADHLKKLTSYFSGMAHPFSNGLKMYYGGAAIMSREPDNPYPIFKPTLNIKAHHSGYSDEEKMYFMDLILIFFNEVLRLLTKICKLDFANEIDNYSELHTSWSKKQIRK